MASQVMEVKPSDFMKNACLHALKQIPRRDELDAICIQHQHSGLTKWEGPFFLYKKERPPALPVISKYVKG